MKNKLIYLFWWGGSGLILLLGFYLLLTLGRPAPLATQQELYNGVTYQRVVHYLPHSMVAHILIVDRKTAGAKFFVTPGTENLQSGTIQARTTSGFLEEFGLQIAINGDEFFPWWTNSLFDYYPHIGDAVTPNGLAASEGRIYADGLQNDKPEPTLYISRRNELEFNHQPNRIYHAISGDRMLITAGNIVEALDDTSIHPRTAIGTNRNGRYVYLIVVDGRQPFYSRGATLQELAELFKDLGAHSAMALDGGGSATLVIDTGHGQAQLLNSPVHNLIPGRERPVANHLGIYISP